MRTPGQPTFYLRQLGCPKNVVDGENMAEILRQRGYVEVDDPKQADTLIVNTCGFIKAAEEESLQALRTLGTDKRKSQKLIAAGCLAQRWGDRLGAAVPGVDGLLGAMRWSEIDRLLDAVRSGIRPTWIGPEEIALAPPRVARGPSAYLKIADGCDHTCAFCAIPLIKGKHRSKPIEMIVREARQLVARGVREIVLVSQDSSGYGKDFGLRDGLATMLDRLVEEVPDVPWIRVMYVYPGTITDRLVETFARHPRIVKYVDMPLQHADRDALARMRRPRQDPLDVIRRFREAMPDIAMRSTFIVGFPGETEEEFGRLLAFFGEAQLDRVGVFQYSPEDGTLAAKMDQQVSTRVKERRYRRAMETLQAISIERNAQQIGRTLDVLVEGVVENPSETGFAVVGRTYRDAPEIDGMVFVRQHSEPGTIVPVRITEAMAYDLVGEVAAA
ncbi:MAG: 30S ribosomal protein S12 methylthiotransferase RimO [Chloroflexota bacterium]|nr:MAG: 30S ribosomal protein S12 methylthiotransferase RimO [Chloroflexota bacterium]